MRLLPALTAVFLAVCVSGCGRSSIGNQFIGKWTFDREYTLAHVPKELLQSPDASPTATPSPRSSPNEAASMGKEFNTMMNQTLKPMLTQQLLGQLEGQSFTITPKTITGSTGETFTYEIVERAAPNSMTIKFSDGTAQMYTIEDGRISIPTTGSVHFKTYYHRVNQ